MLIKGILSFPTLFTPKVAKGANEAKYSISVLIPPNDPQVAVIQAEVDAAKLNTFPSGYTGTDECFAPYDVKYAGKDYYDPKFSGYFVFSCTGKEADGRPSLVNQDLTNVIDPGAVYPGMVGYVNAAITGYVKGKGGIGGWLNGVMITAEEPPMGRLDNKPSVEQMFAGVSGTAPVAAAPPMATPVAAAPPMAAPPMAAPPMAAPPMATPVAAAPPMATPVAAAPPMAAPPMATPVAAAPVAAPPVAAPVILQMTAKANGVTLEQYLATPGWTEQMLIDQGLAIKPSFG